MTELQIVLLNETHTLTEFDCGVSQLNDYLSKYALSNNQNRSARTYVATRVTRVVGYYTLAVGSVSRSDAPARVSKGLENYPVPIILIARLGVERSEHGHGLGKGLLKDALLRCIRVSDIAGCRAVLVHAKDD
jgi:GNAT superfamily N-acetyltransferase